MTTLQSLQTEDMRKAIARTRASLHQARHLPGVFYTSEDIFRLEVENIFFKDWLCVGREEEFSEAGDYTAFRLLGESVLISRDSDGNLHGLRNMCRHRGVEVAPLGYGNARRFRCPYHAWTYGLSGKLLGAPRASEMKGFDLAGCSLPRIRLECWGGYVFINFDPDCRPLEEHLDADGVREFCEQLRPQDTRLCHKHVFEVDCNWKFVPENLIDIYHVGVIHADTFGGKNFTVDDFRFNVHGHGYNAFYRSDTMAPGGRKLFDTLPWLKGRIDEQFACTTWLRPNMTLFARHDLLQPIAYLPIDVNRTQVTVYTQIPRAFFDAPEHREGFDEKVATYGEFIAQVLGEDTVLLESLQNAARSPGYEPGPFANLERGIHQQCNYWLDRIVGPDEAARRLRIEEAQAEMHDAAQRYGGVEWDPRLQPSRYDALRAG